MRVYRIDPDAVGQWEISTFASSSYLLRVPADGRATATRFGDDGPDSSHSLRRDGEPIELIAWGHYEQLTGIQPAIVVGECMVLLLEPLGDGDATARITTPVVAIFEAP